ncbi:LacI family DNA-binding transcriptional regulator [Saccharopolyspora flava]|uniref:Transcriptional regulator, LacI family n=1 Tax=Saccharopolyspora flava TaxID=95161 RepID=A0A1I6TNN4_9PSEU|nr:LacI family DNA-binding transcriptional regulator [Saccharopolyspora flava]SFS90842.1 transcriptional regulator, LacI family [Saccharopolyspora flava]
MSATLTDVAARARVSPATASRAFNDPDRLAPATLQRVRAAAAELGYETPSPACRTLGVVVPDLANAVFASLLRSIHDQAWHGRHQLVVAHTNEDGDREREALDRFATSTDGIIVCSPRSPQERLDEIAAKAPVVTINATTDHAPSVLIAADDGLRQAAEHLRALGHRHVVYVPGPQNSWADRTRHAALSEHCAEQGLRLTVVGPQSASVAGGLAAAASVVASGATAVVAYNDLVALGVRAGARKLGRHCPDDLSIIGIDDLDVASVSDPGLTSVHVGITDGGTLAVDLVLGQIDGPPRHDDVHMPSQLIVRDSTTTPA